MAIGFPDNEIDKRTSFRIPACTSSDRGELRVGERRIPVRLFDQSAGGFGVTASLCPEVHRGDVVQLYLESEAVEARVTYVGEVPDDQRRGPGASYRLGLKRIQELVPDDDEPPRQSWLAAVLGRARPQYRSHALGAGFALVAVVIGVPLALTVVFHYLAGASPSPLPDAAPKSDDRPAEVQTGSHTASQPAEAEAPASSPDRTSHWASLAQLPGASVFLAPSVIQDLALTDAQQLRFREIVQGTEDALKRLEVKLQRMSRQDQARTRDRLLQAARDEALDVLTPEQRRQFEAQAGRSEP